MRVLDELLFWWPTNYFYGWLLYLALLGILAWQCNALLAWVSFVGAALRRHLIWGCAVLAALPCVLVDVENTYRAVAPAAVSLPLSLLLGESALALQALWWLLADIAAVLALYFAARRFV